MGVRCDAMGSFFGVKRGWGVYGVGCVVGVYIVGCLYLIFRPVTVSINVSRRVKGVLAVREVKNPNGDGKCSKIYYTV